MLAFWWSRSTRWGAHVGDTCTHKMEKKHLNYVYIAREEKNKEMYIWLNEQEAEQEGCGQTKRFDTTHTLTHTGRLIHRRELQLTLSNALTYMQTQTHKCADINWSRCKDMCNMWKPPCDLCPHMHTNKWATSFQNNALIREKPERWLKAGTQPSPWRKGGCQRITILLCGFLSIHNKYYRLLPILLKLFVQVFYIAFKFSILKSREMFELKLNSFA